MDPGESEAEKLDRNLRELLEELRVALPGVQVLFAFLLVAPFNQRFSSLSTGQERLYLLALVFAGLAVAFMLAPAAHHRLTFRLRDKKVLVRMANRFAVVGLVCLGIAMTAAIALITDFVFADTTAAICTAGLGSVYLILWIVYPLWRRTRREANGGVPAR